MSRRMTAVLLIAVFLFVQIAIGGFSGAIVAASEKDKPNVQAVVIGNSEFALDLYKKIGETEASKNSFFSPFSISTALSMTYAGAPVKAL